MHTESQNIMAAVMNTNIRLKSLGVPINLDSILSVRKLKVSFYIILLLTDSFPVDTIIIQEQRGNGGRFELCIGKKPKM